MLLQIAMNILDATIIYLACGTPFGVYFLLKNRSVNFSTGIQSFFIAVFWIPFALLLCWKRVTKELTKSDISEKSEASTSNGDHTLEGLKRRLELHLPKRNSSQMLFELREATERYEGLTLALNEKSDSETFANTELISILNHNNPDLASICFNRRNSAKLRVHQKKARNEFHAEISRLSELTENPGKLAEDVTEFVRLLDDKGGLAAIGAITEKLSRVNALKPVNSVEKKEWNIEKQPQSTPDRKTQLESLAATANSHKQG